MKKKIGIGLILISVIILVFYYVYLYNLGQKNNDDVSNYIESTSIQENINENGTEELVEKEKIVPSRNINYTAILEIPKINLKRGVVDSTKNFKSINYAISVDINSNYPNEMGNLILYAHSGSASISYFKKLNNLEINDSVYIYYNGIKYQYLIYDKYEIEKVGKAKVISSNKDKYITLITCNQSKKGYQIVLIGKLVAELKY